MGDAFFLKKKPKPAGVAARRPAGASAAAPSRPRAAVQPPKAAPQPASTSTSAASTVKAEPEPANDKIVEIQILSGDQSSGLRFNMMRLNTQRDVDLDALPKPVLMNRKQPGPKLLPTYAHDEDGKVIGRYVFDEEGRPILDAEGKPTIEEREEMDMSLVGTAPGQNSRRRGKRIVKEVFHQDVDVIRRRREEMNPWVLESKTPSEGDKPAMPEHWVGRYVEPPKSMVPVLLVNEGEGASFTMIPLGRTYNFEPDRPFKVMDVDQAHKMFEQQAKLKVHDRWALRQEDSGPSSGPRHTQNDRLRAMEQRIMENRGELQDRRPKRETFEADYVREQRNIGRGLEGGADEELDFDLDEHFQDDEDSNTFYHTKEEEEDKKLHEEKQKKEFRMANANFGDRPQIGSDEEDDDDDDLFGEKLTSEGKRLRKVVRKRGGLHDPYASTDDEDSDSDDDDELEKDKDKKKEAPGSAERPSRPLSRSGSRGPDSASGSPSRPDRPRPAGVALLAKRGASRGASPLGSRAGSPLARGASPEMMGRSGSPSLNGRAGSPMARGSTPVGNGREGTPGANGAPRPKSKSAKRKASSQSPAADMLDSPSGSPAPSEPGSPAGTDPDRKKKKKNTPSGTPGPVDGESFPSMVTGDQVLTWLRSQPVRMPQKSVIDAFKDQIMAAGANKDRNQKLFLYWIKQYTDKVDEGRQLKPQYRQ